MANPVNKRLPQPPEGSSFWLVNWQYNY
jgi:hypothetical protein